MKKRIKNLISAFMAGILPIVYISGCSPVDYGGTEQELVVEYAVNAVISHDKNYIIKLQDRAPEEETTTAWINDEPSKNTESSQEKPSGGESHGGQEETSGGGSVPANEGFGLTGFSVESSGYELTEKYPDGNDGFSMVAVNGSKLLVLKFNVKNNTGKDAVLNMTDKGYGYRCLVNNSTRLNAQVTALLNGMNTWNGGIKAGEAKEMVLVFQIKSEVADNLKNISLYITRDGKTGSVVIK